MDTLINEIVRIFNDDDTKTLFELLKPCIKGIMSKRFKLLAVLDSLLDHINVRRDFNNKKIEETKEGVKEILFSAAPLEIDRFFPKEVNELFLDKLDKEPVDLIKDYDLDRDVDWREEIGVLEADMLEDWFGSEKEVLQIVEVQRIRKKVQEVDDWRGVDWSTHGKGGANKIFSDDDPISREQERIAKTQATIEKSYIEGYTDLQKQDIERFDELFDSCKEEGIKINDSMQAEIKIFWHGSPLDKKQENYDNFVNYSTKSLKLTNIDAKVSRLILQTYIIGIFLKLSLKQIYKIFRKVATNKYTSYETDPDDVFKNHTPSSMVTKIMNPIINGMNINPKISYVRNTWDRMINPPLDISELLEYVEQIGKDHGMDQQAWTVQTLINSEFKKAKNPSVESFAVTVKNVLEKYKKEKKLSKILGYLKSNVIKDHLNYA